MDGSSVDGDIGDGGNSDDGDGGYHHYCYYQCHHHSYHHTIANTTDHYHHHYHIYRYHYHPSLLPRPSITTTTTITNTTIAITAAPTTITSPQCGAPLTLAHYTNLKQLTYHLCCGEVKNLPAPGCAPQLGNLEGGSDGNVGGDGSKDGGDEVVATEVGVQTEGERGALPHALRLVATGLIEENKREIQMG